jgi:putative membrane protein
MWTGLLLFCYKYFGLEFKLGNQLHTYLSVALVFLLVQRTNSSYDRYWEGRKQLGALGITARNLAVKSNSVIPDSEKGFRTEISSLIGAYVLCVKEHLRDGITQKELKGLSTANREELENFSSPPNGILCILGKRLRSCIDQKWMAPPEFGSFNSSLDDLQGVLRALDRIRFTPLPFAYVNQLKVFMMIYLGTLPLVLIPKFDYLTLIGMFFAVYAFVGIEEIGLEIEDPFGDDPNDLPIEQICQGTKRDVAEILGVKNN